MTPEQIARKSEHSQQAAFFCWCAKNAKICYPLNFIHAIPNGGLRDKVQASKLRAEGVKAGVPDVFLPFPAKGKHGLYIEFKKPGTEKLKQGGLSDEQVTFAEFLISSGYEYKVVYNWLKAADCVVEYLS